MKLNNKGITLMELLISIVLIGLVLTFLFQLLNDLQHETENNNYAYNNQVNRTEVIYTIEKDLNKYTLVGIEDKTVDDKLILHFHFIKGNGLQTAVLESDYNEYTDELGVARIKYYLRYKDYNGLLTSWEMKGAEIDPCGVFTYYVDNYSNNYYFRLNINLYNNPYHERNNKDRNNAVDDIEITYASQKSNLNTLNGDYLTGNTEVQKQIGYCTN